MGVVVEQSFHRSLPSWSDFDFRSRMCQPVGAMHGDVPEYQVGEFAPPECAGEPKQQDCRVAAFENLVGPPAVLFARGPYEERDAVDQQRVSRGVGSIPRGGLLPPSLAEPHG
ncbi:hypothetical protein HQO82_12765 [Rhodococcus fascians]|nr:hypothetical protein [Rhodococcus fascians]MBY4114695.1 hypothetical protein [Rhodococcus fascians]